MEICSLRNISRTYRLSRLSNFWLGNTLFFEVLIYSLSRFGCFYCWPFCRINITKMNKLILVIIYGLLLVFCGIFLMVGNSFTFQVLRSTLGVMISLSSLLAFIAALSQKKKQVQFAYHGMHALALMVYSILLIVYCNTIDKFIIISIFLFFFYAFSEIIFCIWLFNLSQYVVMKIVVLRSFLGLIVGVGTIVAMNNQFLKLPLFGLLFLVVGVNIMLYVPVMKKSNVLVV